MKISCPQWDSNTWPSFYEDIGLSIWIQCSDELMGMRLLMSVLFYVYEIASLLIKQPLNIISILINLQSNTDVYRIWNEFSFYTAFMKRVVCFYIPEPLARGFKTYNEFHKYRMKWKFISDSFYHMLNSQKRKKNAVLSSFITRFYCWKHANVVALPMTS